MKTYTAENYNDSTPADLIWDCGHKHRTIEAAMKCLANMGDAAFSYGAMIYSTDGNCYDRNGYEVE